MGRITVFTQPNCKYCDKVMCVIRSIIQALADELSAVKPAYGIEVRVGELWRNARAHWLRCAAHTLQRRPRRTRL